MTFWKNTIAFAFAVLLMALPFANSNVFGDGAANTDPECGITIPGTIDMGTFAVGVDGVEVESTMATGGNVVGTLEVTAGDWIGVGTLGTGTATLTGVIATETVTINGLLYTGVAGAKANNEQFSIDTSDVAAATDLAASITADVRAGVTDDVTATSVSNIVLLKSTVLGVSGNTITLATGQASIVISGATLAGAEAAGVTHMESTASKFEITTDGTASTGVAYATKTALAADTVLLVLTTTTTPVNDVRVSFQISGAGTLINLPYSGALTQTLTFTVTCL